MESTLTSSPSLKEGKNRSMVTDFRPYQAVLHSNIDRDSLQTTSEIARASLRFL